MITLKNFIVKAPGVCVIQLFRFLYLSRLLALPARSRLVWKYQQGVNTPAYLRGCLWRIEKVLWDGLDWKSLKKYLVWGCVDWFLSKDYFTSMQEHFGCWGESGKARRRERERESVWERERERVCMWGRELMRVWVWEREKEIEKLWECVCWRERVCVFV